MTLFPKTGLTKRKLERPGNLQLSHPWMPHGAGWFLWRSVKPSNLPDRLEISP
jgi:hypothetical protein